MQSQSFLSVHLFFHLLLSLFIGNSVASAIFFFQLRGEGIEEEIASVEDAKVVYVGWSWQQVNVVLCKSGIVMKDGYNCLYSVLIFGKES